MGNAAAYFGFARRAGKLTLGMNAVKAERGTVYLFVLDKNASPNTRKEAEKTAKGRPLLLCDGLGELVGREGCKVAAVREEHLAQAIASALGEIQE